MTADNLSANNAELQAANEALRRSRVAALNLMQDALAARRKAEEAEQALRESEQKYRSLFKSMSEGFLLVEMILDESGKPVSYRYLDANPALERLTHLKCQEIIGKDAREVLPGVELHWIEVFGAWP